MAKAVVLLSGGLDSQLATKLMIDQGVELHALTSASLFHHHTADEGDEHPTVKAAAQLGVPITLINTNDEMLAMVKAPAHGRGKRMNPCVDCRMFLLRKAVAFMEEIGADFIVTGEVIGQRPMSQRAFAMKQIAKSSGVEGLILRPLCAKRLKPSIPEEKGWVDREKLYNFKGRTRKPQIALAAELGLTDYPAPAGGCLLTDPGFAARLRELIDHVDPDLNDVELLRVARHFRLDDTTKLILGRNQAENEQLEALARAGDLLMDAMDFTGPTSLLRGDASAMNVATSAALTLHYGKAKGELQARVEVRTVGSDEVRELSGAPADDARVAELIIMRERNG
jgi:tRNA-uridine 2-sulfurtransferase